MLMPSSDWVNELFQRVALGLVGWLILCFLACKLVRRIK